MYSVSVCCAQLVSYTFTSASESISMREKPFMYRRLPWRGKAVVKTPRRHDRQR